MCLSRSLPSTPRVATSAATRGRPGDHDSRVCAHADAPTCIVTGAGLGPGAVHPGGSPPPTPASDPGQAPKSSPRTPPSPHPAPRRPPTGAHSASPEGPGRGGPREGAAGTGRPSHVSAAARSSAAMNTGVHVSFSILVSSVLASYLAYEGPDLRKPSWITVARRRKNATARRFR
ncbi:unnamed protein product [Rangifer tarandus platyrhynchus]|uniref:Uncharacterized protein n=1 Tax=Rangifer tarandus platyrhynchus TaxID=3082113 RepID=A0AC59YQF2_RANTA